MTTPATLTTEELDALDKFCDVLMDLHNPDPVRKHAGDTILAAAPRLIEQAREAIRFQAAAITNLVIAKREEARADKLEADSEINTRMLMSVNRCCDIEKARAESAESALSATRERLEIAVEALDRMENACECKWNEAEEHALVCAHRLSRAALSAIAAKACTGGKGEDK